MTPFGRLLREVESRSLFALGDQLVVFDCHHHALFLDQTAGDALGGESWGVRRQAAFEASHALLDTLCTEYGIAGARERLDLAAELFGAMGHGQLEFAVSAEGGTVRARNLSYGAAFIEKYGATIKNRRTLDAFAAGFTAAAASLAFPSDWGALEADELLCVGRGDAACEFFLTRRPERPRFGAVVGRSAIERLPARLPSIDPSSAAAIAARQVTEVLGALGADDEGSCKVFGVRLCLTPISYAAQIAFDTMHLVEKRTPELFPVAFALLRESAQLGAFHLLGGVLASPEWKTVHGAPARDPHLRLEQLVGVARALGWGSIETAEFVSGKTLALRAALTHESAYYTVRHGSTVRSRLAFFQGVALAVMQLLHRVNFFDEEAPIQPGTYQTLWKSGPKLHVEETKSPLRGDDVCEVVVEALAER